MKTMNKRHNDDGSLGSKIYAGCLYSCLAVYTLVFLFGRWFLPPEGQWCPYSNTTGQQHHYNNPDYNYHPCHRYRTPYLLYLHLQEVEFAQRMIFSVLLGGIIGFERRASERPAGIRTMSMVCLGSCFFSMTGQLAFHSSTMRWDAARVAAAVPSGVGFLGAGLIWKGSATALKNIDGEVVKSTSQSVHGMTTAASVWLSAAVGVAVGGGHRLYIVSIYGVSLVILVLRFGPQIYFAKDSDSMQDFDDEVVSELDWESFTDDSSQGLSHSGDDHEVNDLEYRHESTMWGSSNEVTYSYQANTHGNITKKADEPQELRRSSSSLSRHSSAPNIMLMASYEVPIVDQPREKQKNKGSKLTRSPGRKGRGESNMLKLSFHG